MTISKVLNYVTANGDGSNKSWDFEFLIPTKAEMEVIITDTAEVETVADPSTYSVTGLDDEDGGTVTYPLVGDAIASGYKLTINRVLSPTQATKIRNQRRYDPQVVEDALDKLTLLIQQLKAGVDLAVKVPISSGLSPENYLTTLTAIKSAAQTAQAAAEAARDALILDAGYIAVVTDLTGDNTIGTIATDLTGSDTIGTVATNITEVVAVGTNITEVVAVATDLTGSDTIGTVAADLSSTTSKLTTVSTNITEVVAVGGSITEVLAVYSGLTDIGNVAADLTGSDTIGTVAADLTGSDTIGTVAAGMGSVTTVATDLAGSDTIGTVAAIAAQVTTVATNILDVVNVSNNIADIISAANNGNIVLSTNAATGISFAKGEVGILTVNGVTKANASTESTAKGVVVMATEAISAGGTGVFLLSGTVTGLTGLTDTATYYMGTTDGVYTSTAPSGDGEVVRSLGNAIGTTTFAFDPSPTYTVVSNTSTAGPVILEDTTSVGKASGATLTVPAPVDINDGDLLMVFITIDYTTTNGASNPITPPAGWTVYDAYERVNAGSDGLGTVAYYKFALGEDGADYDFADADSRPAAAVLARISGADENDPFDAQGEDTGTADEPVQTSITTNVDDTIVFGVVCFDQNKTRATPYEPTGYTLAEDLDGDADISLAYKAQASAGASGSATWDISSGTRWKGWHFAVKKANATVGGGGGGGGGTGLGPFPLEEDGLGYTIKWTLPINEAGSLSGATDAWEVFCSNSPSYTPGDPDLITYSHPTYFIRSATAYRAASPIRPGAYTSSNSNGPARSEGRHERNYGPTERIRFKSKIKLIQAAANSKGTTVQIHRVSGSPVIKGNWLVDSGGTTWSFRALIKQTDGGSDYAFSSTPYGSFGDKALANSLAFDTEYSIEYDYDPVGGTLKVWFNRSNASTPDLTVTGVSASGLASYIKPIGSYPSFSGSGADSDLFIVDGTDFVLIDTDGSEIARP